MATSRQAVNTGSFEPSVGPPAPFANPNLCQNSTVQVAAGIRPASGRVAAAHGIHKYHADVAYPALRGARRCRLPLELLLHVGFQRSGELRMVIRNLQIRIAAAMKYADIQAILL
jgi:hypothetical protein